MCLTAGWEYREYNGDCVTCVLQQDVLDGNIHVTGGMTCVLQQDGTMGKYKDSCLTCVSQQDESIGNIIVIV